MKKLLILLLSAISVGASAQVDPAFTAKFKTVSDAVKMYHQASEEDKPAKMELVLDAIGNEFYQMSPSEFQSKLSAMLNSPTELAKLANPVGFTQCLASVATSYQSCLNGIGWNPGWRPPSVCTTPAEWSIALCVRDYL